MSFWRERASVVPDATDQAISALSQDRARIQGFCAARSCRRRGRLRSTLMPFKFTAEKRLRIYVRDGGMCRYGDGFVPWDELDIDHVVPRAYGGTCLLYTSDAADER